MVLIKEDDGWVPLFCNAPEASVIDILEAFADRATIEQDFRDVKEVWGAGQQQVRNIWTRPISVPIIPIAGEASATDLNLVMPVICRSSSRLMSLESILVTTSAE